MGDKTATAGPGNQHDVRQIGTFGRSATPTISGRTQAGPRPTPARQPESVASGSVPRELPVRLLGVYAVRIIVSQILNLRGSRRPSTSSISGPSPQNHDIADALVFNSVKVAGHREPTA